MTAAHQHGRHRLGTPGLVHCILHRSVAQALAEYRRNWLTSLLIPAKHSLASWRRHARITGFEYAWATTS